LEQGRGIELILKKKIDLCKKHSSICVLPPTGQKLGFSYEQKEETELRNFLPSMGYFLQQFAVISSHPLTLFISRRTKAAYGCFQS
jgi:hypothetical protein